MAIVKIHCASLASNKFSVVGVLHMLNWKTVEKAGHLASKAIRRRKNHQKKFYIFKTGVCCIYSLGYNYTSLESKKTDFE